MTDTGFLGGATTGEKAGVAAFAVVFLLALTTIAIVWVRIVVAHLRSRRVLRQAGLDPLTAQAELAVRAAGSELLSPHRPVEERLRELDDLLRRGVISQEERAAARARVLGGE